MSIQDPKHVKTPNDMETEQAINSIIEQEHNYTDTTPLSDQLDNKRKWDDINSDTTTPTETNNTEHISPSRKKSHFQRLYRPEHKGPYEVIIQDKDKRKISNPFKIGKIIQSHHKDIVHIIRSGKNLNVTCSTSNSANNLVNSNFLQNYNVFIPSNKIYSTGVIFIEPEISETEILNDLVTKAEVISASRIKKKVNQELKNTNYVRLTFDSDTLPDYVFLNYIRMKVDNYIIPVKQCFRCFSYGHVASSPCNNTRLCRECGDTYHDDQCSNPKKCIHCQGPHSSNSKQCPEFLRQKNIKLRMSIKKEDYNTASIFYPVTYKKQNGPSYRYQTYSETLKSNNTEPYPHPSPKHNPGINTLNYSQFPELYSPNRFSSLTDLPEPPDKHMTPQKDWLRNPTSGKTYNYRANRPYKPITAHQPSKQQTQNNAANSVSQTVNNNQDKERLKSLFNSKLSEIREKLTLSAQNPNVKKMIDEVFSAYIDIKNPKQITTTKKSGSQSNNIKTGTKHS